MTRNALARTYRPRTFSEVTMQEHVSETLKAAVARDRVAHAYLFCGPRGVGKTTAARVLAMALNCAERTPEGEPCGACDSCERIWAGRTSLDVVEIDAASNRGVDDARDLRERAMYAPTDERRFKVYIIDEAHMLTREAWNALLKILEEPPPRVIFVFATTEPQKIQQAAPPILSRCQRFDFRRISLAGIVDRLQAVLEREGMDADPEALVPIARKAEGGMRDALSLLDQVLSFAEGKVTVQDVRRVLGVVDEELYLQLFDLIAERRHAGIFAFVRGLVDEGYDLTEFYKGLTDALRELLVVRLEGPEALELRGDLRDQVAERAARFATGDLLRMLAQVAELDTEGRFRKSGNPRLMLEALLLRFAHLDRTVELEELIRAAGGLPPGEQEPFRGRAAAAGGEGAREDGRDRAPHAGEPVESSAAAERQSGAPAAAGRGDVDVGQGSAHQDLRSGAGHRHGQEQPRSRARRQGSEQEQAEGQRQSRGRIQGQGQGQAADRAEEGHPRPKGQGQAEGQPGGRNQSGPGMPAAPAAGGDSRQGATPPSSSAPSDRTAAVAAAGRVEGGGSTAATAIAPPRTRGEVARLLRELAASSDALPKGIPFALRTARVEEVEAERIRIGLLPGPALERLNTDAAALRALSAVLQERLGGPVSLEVVPAEEWSGAGDPPARLTTEAVKRERLGKLAGEEPVLGRAVEEWDLELMD